ncbi:MAG: lactonase family protein [Gaiellaceae bacterium]
MRPTLAALTAAAVLAAAPAACSAGTLTPLGCTKDVHADSTFQHCATTEAGLNGAIGAVVSPDSRNLYATTETAGELTTFVRDPQSGRTQQAGCFKAADWNSTLDGPSSCTQTADGLNGAVGVAISPDGTTVYTGGVNDSAVAAFARDPSSGQLHEIGCIEKLDGTSPASCSVRGDGLGGARSIAVSPDGRNVYVGSHGHALAEFVRNPATGALVQLPAPDNCIEDPADNNTASGIINGTGKATCPKTASGLAYVRTVTVSPDGRNVYAATDFGQAISQFSRDLTTGALTPLGCIRDPAGPTYESCSSTVSGLGWVFGIVISPDGRFAYTSADGIINVFSRDSSGILHKVSCVSEASASNGCAEASGIDDAEALTLSPDGGTLYAAAFRGGEFAIFHRDEATGQLIEEGCVEASQHSAPHCSQTADGIYQPRVVAPSPDGRSLYVTTSVGSDVAAFATPPTAEQPSAPAPPPVAKAAAPHSTSTKIAVKRMREKRRASAAAVKPRFRIAGAVRGASGGRVTLQLQRRKGRKWVTRKKLRTSVGSAGAYSKLTRLATRGARWRVRALYSGAAGALPSASRYVALPRAKR